MGKGRLKGKKHFCSENYAEFTAAFFAGSGDKKYFLTEKERTCHQRRNSSVKLLILLEEGDGT